MQVTVASVADKYINAIGGKANIDKVFLHCKCFHVYAGTEYRPENDESERRKRITMLQDGTDSSEAGI
jgi:phosphotransferase system IIB component